MSLNSTRDYEVLLIESKPEILDSIVDAFKSEDISVTIAEAKSLTRANSLVTSENINTIIFGPSLSHQHILDFFAAQDVLHKFPSLYLYFKENQELKDKALEIGLSETAQFPLNEEKLSSLLKRSKQNYAERLIESQKADSGSNLSLSDTKRLAFILEKLAGRLIKVSTELKGLPAGSSLKDASIPQAVNRVILEATQFRKERESEDLKELIKNIIK